MNWNSLISGHETLPALTEDSVHVWRASTPGIRLEEFEEILSGEEQDRAERFYFERDRRAFIACRGMLRRLISLYTGEDAARIRLVAGPHGKLFLARTEPPDLRFTRSALTSSRSEPVSTSLGFPNCRFRKRNTPRFSPAVTPIAQIVSTNSGPARKLASKRTAGACPFLSTNSA